MATVQPPRYRKGPSRLDLAMEILRKGEKKKPQPEAEPVPVKGAAKKPNQSKTAKPPRAKGGKSSKGKS